MNEAKDYHKAFILYGVMCVWSMKKMVKPSLSDLLDPADGLAFPDIERVVQPDD